MNDHDNRIHQQCWSGKNFSLYSTTSMSFSPLLRLSHFAVILHRRRSWKTNKNPFSNFILFEPIWWSPAGRFEPQLPIAKPCSLVVRTRRCGKARAAILKGQHSKPTCLKADSVMVVSEPATWADIADIIRPSYLSTLPPPLRPKHLAQFKEETWDISMHCKYTACSAVRFLRWRERTDRGRV